MNAESPVQGVATEEPPRLSEADIRSIIVGLIMAILLGALDQTIISVALGRISEELHGFSLLAWVVSGYLVASTVVTPIYGKLGDLFGRRLMLSIAISVFLLASLACALAQSMPALVAARVLQGFGGGGLISISQAVIADIVPLRRRGRYQGYISGVFALSSVLGPVAGGLFTHYLSWRWCFWINLPLGVAAFLVSRRALAKVVQRGTRRGIDYLGTILLAAGLTTLLLAITRVGQGLAWNDPGNLDLFGAALFLLVFFALWERRAEEPIIPLHLFRIRAVTLCCLILFIGFFNLIGMSVMMPLRFQVISQATADVAAWRLIPLSLMIPAGAYIGGRTMSRTGRYRPIQMIGAVMAPLGLLGVAFADVRQIVPTALAMMLAGLGIGLQFPTSLVAVQNAVPVRHIGIATALSAFSRSLGGAIGIAVLSTLLLNLLGVLAEGAGGGIEGSTLLRQILTHTVTGGAVAAAALREDADRAFRIMFLVGAALATLPFFLTFLVPDLVLSAERRRD